MRPSIHAAPAALIRASLPAERGERWDPSDFTAQPLPYPRVQRGSGGSQQQSGGGGAREVRHLNCDGVRMTRRACAAAAAALGSGCGRTGPTPERGGGRESLVGRSGGEAGGDGKDGGWVRLMTAARATWGEGGGGGGEGLEPDWLGGRWAPLAGACGDRRRSGKALSAVWWWWWWWWSRRERRRQVGAVILMGRIPFADRWLHTGGEAQQQQLEACRGGPLVSGTGSSSSASQHERGSGRKLIGR
jgi:hypothetical protein